MLSLLFQLGELRCAVACSSIEEVLPLSALERLPGCPPHVLGLLAYRGGMLTVLDCGLLLGGGACPERLSTRLLVIGAQPRFGLVCAGVHDVRALKPLPAGARAAAAHPLIARVMLADEGAVHCLAVEALAARAGQLRGEETREDARAPA